MLRRSIGPLCGVVVAVVIVGTACGDDGPGDAETFCSEVQEHQAVLVGRPETVDDIDDYVDLYRRIGDVAPLAIEPDWAALTLNFETASTVVPEDPESVQRVARQAYATEKSSVAVKDWLLTNCGVDMGPVATIVPQAVAPPATTVPPEG
ncbi:MAG: hypothetical protein ABW219_08100 [Ilumatobacteraceae bacterium]